MLLKKKVQGFNSSVVRVTGGDWGKVRGYNHALKRLAKRRLTKVERTGLLADSKIAWQTVILQQSLLYRIVDLAVACAKNWNQGNVLGSVLAARALLETMALTYDVEREIQQFGEAEKFQELHDYVIKQTYATRDKEVLKEVPEIEAKNAMTHVKHLTKVVPLILEHYLFLCEFCHPNHYGHFRSFASLNINTQTVRFSTSTQHGTNMLDAILAVYQSLPGVEMVMDSWDDLVLKLAKVRSI
jgi:hypothetical protein